MSEADLIYAGREALRLFQRLDRKADDVEDKLGIGSEKAMKWRELAYHAEEVSEAIDHLCDHIRKLEGRA